MWLDFVVVDTSSIITGVSLHKKNLYLKVNDNLLNDMIGGTDANYTTPFQCCKKADRHFLSIKWLLIFIYHALLSRRALKFKTI